MARRRWQRGRAAATLLFASAASAWGCNAIFGIEDVDRPLRTDDGGASAEAGTDGSAEKGAACLVDSDCPTIDPCLSPRCDPAARRCLYASCQPRSCSVGLCKEGPSRACTETAEPYTMVAVRFSLPGVEAGCGGNAQSCFAAVFPFAFVGTASGVVAVSLADYRSLEPARSPVTLPFTTSRIVASGDVVYFLGPVTAGKLAIASLRVPTDPRTTAFAPTAVEVPYPFPSARIFPLPPSDVLVVHDDATLGYPSARLDPTFRSGAPIVSVPPPPDAGGASPPAAPATGMYGASGVDLDAGAGAILATSSGDRLVLALEPRGARPQFALVTGAGGPRAEQGPFQGGPTAGPSVLLGPSSYGSAADGTVVHMAPFSFAGGSSFSISVLATWIMTGSSSPRTEANDGVYAEQYNEPYPDGGDGGGFPSVPAQGAVLPLDGEILFTISSASSATPSGFEVLARRRVPGGGGGGTVALGGKNGPIMSEPAAHLAPATIATTSTAGLGLLFHAVAGGARIVVLDPRCPPP